MDGRREIVKLASDGKNYIAWKQAVDLRLAASIKCGYRLNRFIIEPVPEEPLIDEAEATTAANRRSTRAATSSTLTASDRDEAAHGEGISPHEKYLYAKSYVVDFLVNAVAEQLRGGIQGMEPISILRHFQERFRPHNTSTIAMCEGKLQALEAQRKDHPYDSVRDYFEQVDELEKERALVDGSSFENHMLLHTVLSSLGDLDDPVIRTVTLSWKTSRLN